LYEAFDAGLLRPLDRLQRALEVHGALALDLAVGAGPGGEHHGLAPGEGLRELLSRGLLDVEQPDLGAQRLELLPTSLVADEGDRRVSGSDQQRMELEPPFRGRRQP
jgi:hypothetical protein